MSKINTFINLCKTNPKGIKIAIFDNMTHMGLFKYFSDEDYLKIAFKIKMGKALDLRNPKTYNEKLKKELEELEK